MSSSIRDVPAATEPPIVVEHREQLIYLLREAAELEHTIMCEYLFAQWSLKRSVGEGVTEQQLERILAWDAAIEGVAIQEMLHLALAVNLLCALGAPPHFHRPNFPILAGWYPPGVQIALIPVSRCVPRTCSGSGSPFFSFKSGL